MRKEGSPNLNSSVITMLTDCSFEGNIPTKLGDSVVQTVSCFIGHADIHNALSDLGAGLRGMPFLHYKKLDLEDYVPH